MSVAHFGSGAFSWLLWVRCCRSAVENQLLWISRCGSVAILVNRYHTLLIESF